MIDEKESKELIDDIQEEGYNEDNTKETNEDNSEDNTKETKEELTLEEKKEENKEIKAKHDHKVENKVEEPKHEEHKNKHEEHKHKHEEHKHKSDHKVHKEPQEESSSNGLEIFKLVLIVMLTALLIFNLVTINSLSKGTNKDIVVAEKAPLIEVYKITNQACTGCSLADADSTLRFANVNITKQAEYAYTSTEAKAMIAKYSITKLPAVVITGEIDKLSLNSFTKNQDALVFSNTKAPYSTIDGVQKGLVNVTIITDKRCTECTDATTSGLYSAVTKGVYFANTKTMDSADAALLLFQYQITKLPAVIFSSGLSEYPIASEWSRVGTKNQDGTYTLTTLPPPFYNITTKTMMGQVDIVWLSDSSCTTCYNVKDHEPILQGFGMAYGNQKELDVRSAEGKALADKYGITMVPTIVLSPSAGLYPTFDDVWQSVGTKASDGTYVFTGFNVWTNHAYMDLATGKVNNNTATQ